MLALLLLACGNPPDPELVVVKAPQPQPVAEAPPPSVAPGPLWLEAEGRLLRLDAQGARAVEGLAGPVEAWTLDGQGRAWLIQGDRLYRVEADTTAQPVVEIPDGLVPTSVEDLAIGPEDRVWIVGPMVVASWDGRAWAAVPAEHLGPQPVLLEQIAVDAAGAVFVLGKATVLRGQGEAWTGDDLESLAPGMEFADDLVVARDGRAWLSFVGDSARGVLAFAEGRWSATDLDAAFDNQPQTMSLAGDGSLVRIAPRDDGLAWAERRLELTAAGTLARELQGIAVDDRGRAWARTDRGLLRWDPDGTVQEYALGTLGLPATELQALAVHAGGPDLAAAGAVEAPVRGTLRKDGDWLKGAAVSLCDDSEILFEQHPCEGASLRHDARTDELGAFSYPAVAQGSYDLIVQTGEGDYALVIGAQACREMLPGQVVDLGELGLRD